MRIPLALLLLLIAPATPLRAQEGGTTPPDREDPLVSTGDAAVAAGFVLGSVALWPVDQYLARRIQDSTLQARPAGRRAATAFNTLARPGTLVISGALWAAGAATGYDGMRDVGRHGTEAILLTEALTRVVKGVAGRARPNVSLDEPHDFKLFRGFRDNRYQSFVSGHSSDAFAAATVFTAEAARAWPGWEWVVGPVLYGGAALSGLSRMYDNKHWATDVLAGGALGTFVGLQVVRWHDRSRDAEGAGEPARGASVSLTISGDGSVALGLGPGR